MVTLKCRPVQPKLDTESWNSTKSLVKAESLHDTQMCSADQEPEVKEHITMCFSRESQVEPWDAAVGNRRWQKQTTKQTKQKLLIPSDWRDSLHNVPMCETFQGIKPGSYHSWAVALCLAIRKVQTYLLSIRLMILRHAQYGVCWFLSRMKEVSQTGCQCSRLTPTGSGRNKTSANHPKRCSVS